MEGATQWLVTGIGVGIALALAFYFARRLFRKEPMSDLTITIGDPAEHARFVQEYRAFLIEWRELQELVKQVMLGRTINSPNWKPLEGLSDDDPRVIAAEDRYKADLSCFVLARTAVDDFSEILILASNGFGTGALKTLRGMYERVVTSAYVALFPEVSRSLVDSVWTQNWKVWIRATKMMPDLASEVDQQNIDELRRNAEAARKRLNESICKECLQIKEVHSWTKVDLATMAQKVDERLASAGAKNFSLSNYYLRCYLQPTALEHATGTSVNEKFELVDGRWTYKIDSSGERRQAILFGHALLLLLMSLQNDHFGYGLDDAINARGKAYRRIWLSKLPEDERKKITE